MLCDSPIANVADFRFVNAQSCISISDIETAAMIAPTIATIRNRVPCLLAQNQCVTAGA